MFQYQVPIPPCLQLPLATQKMTATAMPTSLQVVKLLFRVVRRGKNQVREHGVKPLGSSNSFPNPPVPEHPPPVVSIRQVSADV